MAYRPHLLSSLLLPAAAGLAALAPAAPARACGGLFCDGAPMMPTPVDQTGENVIFAIDEAAGTVEAHIQIQYTGDPQKFGWVIPVTAVPEFAIGSELLFTNLLSSTVPTYSNTPVFDCQMRDPPNLGCGSVAAEAGNDTFAGTSGLSASDTSDTGPDIVKREIVGAYEIVVLSGGTSQEVFDWLQTNGYYQDADALPILDDYLKENYYFAAAKLLHSAGVDAIQPIVMTYKGDRPCVPLRLTRIAATPHMGVRVFGLGHSRYAPSNYKHVELNEVRIDWANNAMNYMEVVRNAVDTPGADGHGFITEFAGSTGTIDRTGLFDVLWNAKTFEGAEPVDPNTDYTVIDALESQNLVDCSNGFECSFLHPQILPLLRQYLPAPPGIGETDFYLCMECYKADIDQAAWDGAAFAKAMQERIIDPGQRAVGLLDRWQSVTRLLTVISPEEMTVDPEFIENPDLPPVQAARSAQRFIPCAGADKMVLADGSAILHDPTVWPGFPEMMPWALRVETIAAAGAPQVVADLKADIDAALRVSNGMFDYDDGRGVHCALGRNSWSSALAVVVIFGFAWRGRRRRLDRASARG